MILKNVNYIRKILKSSIGKSSIIYPSSFLTATGLCIIELGIIFYIKEIFGATPSQIGYFTALWSFCYIIGLIFIRPLFNSVLPRYLLIGSSILMFFFILMILYIKVFTYAFIYYDLYGLAMSFFWPPIMGWLSQDIEGSRLGKSMSFFNLTWSGGIIIGPLLAGILSAISPEIPLYVGSALFLLTGVIIAGGSILLPQIRADRGNDQSPERESGRVDMSTVLRYPGWIGLFTTFVVIGMMINIFPVFARDELFLKKELIGLLMQSRTFIATFVFIILGQTTFWHFKITPMITGQIGLACLVILMNFTSSPLVLAFLIAFIGALRALSYNSSLFHGVSGSINRTGRMAIHEALLATGLIFGSSFGGVVYQKYSMTVVYYFCGSIVFLGAVIQSGLYLLLRKQDSLFFKSI